MITLYRAQDLLNLQPNFRYMRQFTRRALIASFSSPRLTLMRYFAPQYGIDEDSATGSASVQLAQYQYTQTGNRRLIIHQCSADGGRIKTHHLGARKIRVAD
nr:PhzF family phenazine biosynthesis protein [Gilvimarinus xylanilyticus]